MTNETNKEYLEKCDHEVLKLLKPGHRVTAEEFNAFFTGDGAGMNSYERQLLYPEMELGKLLHETMMLQRQITLFEHDKFGRPRSTYEEVLLMVILPAMMDRLKTAGDLAKKVLEFREHENKVEESQRTGGYGEHVIHRLELLVTIFDLAEEV